MPSSPEVDLEAIQNSAKEVVEKGEGTHVRFEQEPVAFGLKAVNVFFELDEEKELEPIENELAEIENVTSEQVTDMRRAFG